jgi:hypothetical protein
MPSLPGWVASRVALLKTETEPDPVTGRHRPVPTLPCNSTLNASERDALSRHAAELEACARPKAADDATAEETVLVIVTKLMLALPSPKQNEASAEARGEAYMAALDDLPPWAVAAAARRWYRGDAGKNERGELYDCHWCPAPADLRAIARLERSVVDGLDLHRIDRTVTTACPDTFPRAKLVSGVALPGACEQLTLAPTCRI